MVIMLKAIRVIAYQNMPNYRKPSAIAIQDSYKLPPYSTVIGFIHTACGFNEYHPMKISIAGCNKSSVVDMYTRYLFGTALEYDSRAEGYKRHQLYTEDNEGAGLGGYTKNLNKDGSDGKDKRGIIRGQGYAQLMVDMELAIYIVPDNPDELETIKNGLLNPARFPALGRHEDILRIDNVEIVELFKQTDDVEDEDGYSMKYDALVPLDIYEKLELECKGTIYNMNKVFRTSAKGKKLPFREVVERVRAKLIKSGTNFYVNTYFDLYGEERIGVFLA